MLAFEPNRSWFRSRHVLTDCEDRTMTMRRRAMWLLKVHNLILTWLEVKQEIE